MPTLPEESGIQLCSWRVYFDWQSHPQPSLDGHVFDIPATAGGDSFNYTFRNVTSDGTLENQIRLN